MSDFNVLQFLAQAVFLIVPLILALSVHEFAHGWMALRKGDNTAKMMGRLTLNPGPHIDPIGTLALPLVMIATGVGAIFGWAKPVPVNPRNLAHPRKDMFWIAIAGPASNVLQGFVGLALLYVVIITLYQYSFSGSLFEFFRFYIRINFILAAFNMIPIHPLDGGKVLARFLPHHINDFLENNHMQLYMVLIALFVLGVVGLLLTPVDAFARYLISWVQQLAHMTLFG